MYAQYACIIYNAVPSGRAEPRMRYISSIVYMRCGGESITGLGGSCLPIMHADLSRPGARVGDLDMVAEHIYKV